MLKEELLTYFDEINVEQIVYKQWVSTDRSIYIGDILFISFCKKIEFLRPHSFIATQQA